MKKQLLYVLALTSIMALTACGGGNNPVPGSSAASSSKTSGGSKDSGTTGGSTGSSITNADLPLGQTTYTDAAGKTQQLNRNSIYTNAGAPHVNSYHDDAHRPVLLVAPMSFVKDPTDSMDIIDPTEELLEKIRVTFEGTAEETKAVDGYISVQEFYERSSYGKGAFDVYVLPCWVPYNGTAKQFRSKGQGGLVASDYVKTWYAAEYKKENHGALGADARRWSDFDSDGDGYIDLIWNVYAYPDQGTDYWWAYVTYTSQSPNVANPNIKTLAFASTNFMKSYNGYDSHTFIHETGHTLGLDDYYDYNNGWAPMGGVDYMDHNLGDHNAYSKFSLGWTNPMVLTEDDLAGGKSATITLKHGSTSGESLILASPDYNGTAFDEYMILELVGPYGLCEDDYKNGYQSTMGFTVPGVRVIHVDARTSGDNHDDYLKTADDVGQKALDVRIGNTSDGGRMGLHYDGDYWPYEEASGSITKRYMSHASLIESTIKDTNWTKVSTYDADNESIFKEGERLRFNSSSVWCKEFMPSKTNLWNKAKTTTGWTDTKTQTYTIDEDCTINYNIRVNSITVDPVEGPIATLTIKLDK